ncbi:PhnD/SsuA/transferrin family substrate-binding protein [Eubacteriales bacterium OttesenSCG-928-M02]|nr:PhnD/SsuA/transferrin family substrate-binding protein [Eubacteriales bacterium OttesenSCG-928-M02]
MKKHITLLLAILMVAVLVIGCGNNANPTPSQTPSTGTTKDLDIRLIKGPSALGAVKLFGNNAYGSVDVIASPEEMNPKFINGEVDIAAVPPNLASVLYSKTSGGARVVAVSTLGMLYILSSDDGVQSIADLAGKTIHTAGKGAVPEYVLRSLLKKNDLTPDVDVTIQFHAEHAEVSSLAVAGQADIVLLPEPFVTSTLSKADSHAIAVDMTEAWKEKNGDVPLVMGCVIAGKDVSDEAIDAFLKDYEASTKFANENIDDTAKIIGDLDIMPEAVVKAALPRCNIVYLTGNEMKAAMVSFLTALYEEDPKSVGGSLPGDDFYYGVK